MPKSSIESATPRPLSSARRSAASSSTAMMPLSRDLELEVAGVEAGILEGGAHIVDEKGALELKGGEVDRDSQGRPAGPLPGGRAIAGGREHRPAELDDIPRALGNRDERGGKEYLAVGQYPSSQGLGPDDAPPSSPPWAGTRARSSPFSGPASSSSSSLSLSTKACWMPASNNLKESLPPSLDERRADSAARRSSSESAPSFG